MKYLLKTKNKPYSFLICLKIYSPKTPTAPLLSSKLIPLAQENPVRKNTRKKARINYDFGKVDPGKKGRHGRRDLHFENHPGRVNGRG